MSNTQINELINIRNANIDKLNNYLESGKTPDEGIVKKTIEKIRKNEMSLEGLNYTDFDRVQDDGTFLEVKKSTKEKTVVKGEEVKDTTIVKPRAKKNKEKKESDKDTIVEPRVNKRRSSFGLSVKEDKKETAIFSVKLNEDVAAAFESERAVTKKTASAIATELLVNIFDKETNTFSIDIAANKKMQSKDTSLNLPADIKQALSDNAKAKNMKTYEYFNKLMEAILEQ